MGKAKRESRPSTPPGSKLTKTFASPSQSGLLSDVALPRIFFVRDCLAVKKQSNENMIDIHILDFGYFQNTTLKNLRSYCSCKNLRRLSFLSTFIETKIVKERKKIWGSHIKNKN